MGLKLSPTINWEESKIQSIEMKYLSTVILCLDKLIILGTEILLNVLFTVECKNFDVMVPFYHLYNTVFIL